MSEPHIEVFKLRFDFFADSTAEFIGLGHIDLARFSLGSGEV